MDPRPETLNDPVPADELADLLNRPSDTPPDDEPAPIDIDPGEEPATDVEED